MKSPILFFLALIDILAGLAFYFRPFLNYGIAILITVKGIWSIVIARPHISIFGFLDTLTGILIFLEISGISNNFFGYIGLIVLIKGMYSMLFSV